LAGLETSELENENERATGQPKFISEMITKTVCVYMRLNVIATAQQAV